MAELEEEIPGDSVFHPNNIQNVSLITLLRCYDLLAVIARGVNAVEAESVLDVHEAGGIVGSAPWLDAHDNE